MNWARRLLSRLRGCNTGWPDSHEHAAGRGMKAADQMPVRPALDAIHERIASPMPHLAMAAGQPWPGRGGDCQDPPCSREDGWICSGHLRPGDPITLPRPRGRHHAPPVQSHGHDVILATVTDLAERRTGTRPAAACPSPEA